MTEHVLDRPRKNWRRGLIIGIIALAVIGALALWISTTSFYSWAARKTVAGEVVSIANLTPGAVMTPGGMVTPRATTPGGGITYSFAIAIKADDGTIYSASSEDRQWAAVREGYRVRATFFPYSPLNWTKQGTYHNARLRQILAAPSRR